MEIQRTRRDALANKLGQRGVKDIRVYDVSKTHPSLYHKRHLEIQPSGCLRLLLIIWGLYYPMDNLLHEMAALGVKNRKVAIIGNHSWASAAQKLMTERFSSMKNMEIIGETFDIKSRLKDDEEQKLDDLADVIAASVLGNTEE